MTSTGTGRRLLAEAVVVVASILLAFAIDASWDRRQARENEREVLRGLQSELREGRLAIEASRESTSRAHEQLTRFISAPRSELLGMSPSTAFAEVFVPLTRQFGGTLPTGSLDAATGSGELASISDPALRTALARLGSAHGDLKQMRAVIGEMDARTVAMLGEYEGVRRSFTAPEPMLEAETLGALRDDPRIMGAASAKIWFTGGYLTTLGALDATIAESLELIAAVLGD